MTNLTRIYLIVMKVCILLFAPLFVMKLALIGVPATMTWTTVFAPLWVPTALYLALQLIASIVATPPHLRR